MNTENLTKFAEAAAADPALKTKIQSIHAQAAREIAEKLAALSAESGTAFTAEEFLAAGRGQAADLSEEELEAVAGGQWRPSANNIITSILTVGIGCAVDAALSAGKGDVDGCQPDSMNYNKK